MKKNHIIELLERGPLSSLTENELRAISTHTEICPACHQAYEAARISTLLVKERAAETMEPSPFFQTRVLAALREQQANNKVPAFWRLWKTAGALVSSMALTTAALAVLSFVVPGAGTVTTQSTTAESSPYSAEAIVFNQDQNEDQMTDEQVLSVIYADEVEAK
jgi:anti-sigma factor ChrR (cupin superfamily)